MDLGFLCDRSGLSALVKPPPSFIFSQQVGEACTHQTNLQNGDEEAGSVIFFLLDSQITNTVLRNTSH